MQTVDQKDPALFRQQIEEFARRYNTLLIPDTVIFADTVIWLDRLVQLSDKVLAIKSYFNQVRDYQRLFARASLYADVAFADIKKSNPEEFASVLARLRAKSLLVLDELVSKLPAADARNIKHSEQRFLCTEDVFMAACAFLSVDIAKQGSVFYLQGRSPDFKETKKNRNPINLSEEITLKTLSSSLARPEDDRGTVEKGYIQSGERHLTSMYNLYFSSMLGMVAFIKQKESEGKTTTKAQLRDLFGISLTDYERAMAMARREGLLDFRRKKEQSSVYTLNVENEKFVRSIAAHRGVTPLKALNQIIADWRASMDIRRKGGYLGASATKE